MATDAELKPVYETYKKFGAADKFCGSDYAKFCKDSGLWVDKGNKFNLKPPNRVDFVFTYSCVNGEGGAKGNKNMTFAQFLFSLRGISKELSMDPDEVRRKASEAKPQTTGTTKAGANRFHDDSSNYTGSHRLNHGGEALDKDAARAMRKNAALSEDELKAATEMQQKVESTFAEFDADGSGFLESGEIVNALKSLKPDASQMAIEMVYKMLMKYGDKNGDGKLDPAEFKNAYNRLTEILNTMGSGGVVPDEAKLVKDKFKQFANFGTTSGDEMDSQRFKIFCQQLFPDNFPDNPQGTADIDLIFAEGIRVRKTKPDQTANAENSKAKKITFSEFFEVVLFQMAQKCKCTLDDIVGVILQCDGPVSKGTTKAETNRFADNVERKKSRSFEKAVW